MIVNAIIVGMNGGTTRMYAIGISVGCASVEHIPQHPSLFNYEGNGPSPLSLCNGNL